MPGWSPRIAKNFCSKFFLIWEVSETILSLKRKMSCTNPRNLLSKPGTNSNNAGKENTALPMYPTAFSKITFRPQVPDQVLRAIIFVTSVACWDRSTRWRVRCGCQSAWSSVEVIIVELCAALASSSSKQIRSCVSKVRLCYGRFVYYFRPSGRDVLGRQVNVQSPNLSPAVRATIV